MIGVPHRLHEILCCAASEGIFPEWLRFVHPYADRHANRVLFAGTLHTSAGVSILPPLVVHAAKGRFHPEVESLYRGITPP
jgi:tRNA1(Val) A37 N6-methylase TrmN6